MSTHIEIKEIYILKTIFIVIKVGENDKDQNALSRSVFI
jgi:hypothetical protein